MSSMRRNALLLSTSEYEDASLRPLPRAFADGRAIGTVLAHPDIGSFTVARMHGALHSEAALAIEDLFASAKIDDTLILYISGHGIRDSAGRLCFPMTNSISNRWASTAISAQFIHTQMVESRSRRMLVILDCCYGGAFPTGLMERGSSHFDPHVGLVGRGAVVMSGSSALEYAFEAASDTGTPTAEHDLSVFTSALVRGLDTGDADRNDDGVVEALELYQYAYDQVKAEVPEQTPTLASRVEGRFVVARSVRSTLVTPRQAEERNEPLVVRQDNMGGLTAVVGRRTLLAGAAGLVVRSKIGRSAEHDKGWDVQIEPADEDPYDFGTLLAERWHGTRIVPTGNDGGNAYAFHVSLPSGRNFGGVSTTMVVLPCSRLDDDKATVEPSNPEFVSRWMTRPHRTWLVAATQDTAGGRFFLLDKREAVRQLGTQTSRRSAQVRVPTAYELDDLVYGIVWGAANLDDSLLDDDMTLSGKRRALREYEELRTSAVGADLAADLNPIGRSWLGSYFCARYILKHLMEDGAWPIFWTREQTGEEACLWIFVDHKIQYLGHTGSPTDRQFGSRRMFCIPEQMVASSPPSERLLLLMSAALMEALGTSVDVCVDSGFTDVKGFVLQPSKKALIANWVRAEGIWHVDTMTRAADLREFANTLGDATAATVSSDSGTRERLMAFADYLEIDWLWLQRRCREISTAGSKRLCQPKSRLLSTEGLDRACRLVASI